MWGRISGTCNTRYVVGGQAFENAHLWLKADLRVAEVLCDSGVVAAADASHAFVPSVVFPGLSVLCFGGIPGVTFSSFEGVSSRGTVSAAAETDAPCSTLRDEEGNEAPAVLDIAPVPPMYVELSPCSLDFASKDVEAAYRKSLLTEESGRVQGRILVATMLGVQVMFIAVLLINRLALFKVIGIPFRRQDGGAVAMMCIAVVITVGRLLLRRRNGKKLEDGGTFWGVLDTIAHVVALLWLLLAMLLIPETTLTNDLTYVGLGLAISCLLQTLQWGLLRSLCATVIGLHGVATAVDFFLTPSVFMRGGKIGFALAVALGICVSGYYLHRHFRVKFCTGVAAHWFYSQAEARGTAVEALIENLVPRHIASVIARIFYDDAHGGEAWALFRARHNLPVFDSEGDGVRLGYGRVVPSENVHALSGVFPNDGFCRAFDDMPVAQGSSEKLRNLMYVEGWDELVHIMVRVTTNIADERGNVWTYLSECVNRFGAEYLESVGLLGDVFQACGPLKEARQNFGQHNAVLGAIDAATKFARHLICLGPPAHFTVVLGLSDGYGAVIGSKLLAYNVFGPVVRTSAGILDASPLVTSSCALATASFVRRYRDRAAKARPPLHGHAAVTSQAIFETASQEWSISDALFGPQMRWRVRGLGIVSVHNVERIPNDEF